MEVTNDRDRKLDDFSFLREVFPTYTYHMWSHRAIGRGLVDSKPDSLKISMKWKLPYMKGDYCWREPLKQATFRRVRVRRVVRVLSKDLFGATELVTIPKDRACLPFNPPCCSGFKNFQD